MNSNMLRACECALNGSTKVYTPEQVEDFCISSNMCDIAVSTKQRQRIEIFNHPASFDIETTSTYVNDEKVAFMYEWTLGINGSIMIGRTWDEFFSVLESIKHFYGLGRDRHLKIYVHNLAYEFGFMQNLFSWDKIFSVETHRPLYAVTGCFEFWCSLLLSGMSLEKTGDGLTRYKVGKASGDLDYSKIRNCKTILTDKEIGYCVRDVVTVMAYIQEQIEIYGDVSKIPYTNTARVRKYCKDACFKDKEYRYLMKRLTIEPDIYDKLKKWVFQGGFVHANCFKANSIIDGPVVSYDFTSAYPSIMLSEKFPMSVFTHYNPKSKEEFYKVIKDKGTGCFFDIEFHNIRPRVLFESPISASKCWRLKNARENNGRVYSADLVSMSITDVDFKVFQKFYEWDKFRVSNMYVCDMAPLPKPIVESVLYFYEQKTKLKGVDGMEEEYRLYKSMLNSIYGMLCTGIYKDDVEYDGESWKVENGSLERAVDKYNNDRTRFTYYPWGVWITAYCRRNILAAIYECGRDYVYSDTDSIKIVNAENHEKYFEYYNNLITLKIKQILTGYGIDCSRASPMTINGVCKPLGVFECDGVYKRFKSLGAKRYMYEDELGVHTTISGTGKERTREYIVNKYGENAFDAFSEDLEIPAEYTDKLIYTYVNCRIDGTIEDYNGVSGEYHEKSFVHLEPSSYNMGMQKYLEFIRAVIKNGRVNFGG